MQVGFIGLGAMGRPMASNLINAGFDLMLWNRSAGQAGDLVAAGATEAQTPTECAACDVLVSMLADDEALETVLDEYDLIEAMPVNGVHVNMATVSVAAAERFATRHADANRGYVAAPVLGRPDLAKAAKLNIVAAGTEADRKRVESILATLGAKIWPAGVKPARANAVKLATNYMLVNAVEAMSEATALASGNGVEPATFLEIITQSVFAAPAYQGYAPAMRDSNYDQPEGFRLGLGAKDLELARDTAQSSGVTLPLAESLSEQFRLALDKGLGDQDLSALYRLRSEG